MGGQLLDGDLLVEVALHPRQHVADRVALGVRQRALDVLGLAAVTVRRHHHPPGDLVGDLGALLLAHQVKAGVDPRGRAGGGDHRVLVDVEHVRLHDRPGVLPGEVPRVLPVHGAAAVVQQPGSGQHEGAGADAEHPGAAGDPAPQGVQQLRRELTGRVAVPGRHRDQIGRLQPLQAVLDLYRDARVHAQRRALGRGDREIVDRQAVVTAVGAEDLAHHTEFERVHAVEQNDGHVLEHVSSVPRPWQ